MMKKIYTTLFFLICGLSFGNIPKLLFKENNGQWPNKVLFGNDYFNTKFFVNQNSFNYCIYNELDLKKAHEANHSHSEEIPVVHGHNYEVEFTNANFLNHSPKQEQQEYFNYFLGSDRSKWASNVKAYKELVFTDIYPHINLNLYSSDANVKYDLIVKKGADITHIVLNYKYTYGVDIVKDEIIIKTSQGNVIEKAPIAYQIINGKKVEIKCDYILLNENTIGFECPKGYNKNYDLVIDPTVVVCSYSGASNWTNSYAATFDQYGNIYSLGVSGESDYPTTNGAFQSTKIAGSYNFVISAYNNIGTSKIFSTYLGGDSVDVPICAVVKNNEINVFGKTCSRNFPVTSNAFDTTINGYNDLVISKLNITGTSLIASTYIGGQGQDGYNPIYNSSHTSTMLGEMICDTSGNVYAISATTSTNFPVSVSALSPTLNGTMDACVFKLNNDLSNLEWSTYLGGMAMESGKAIRLDGSGNIYCLGSTTSTNFPVTNGCYSSTKQGFTTSADMYITKLNSTGTTLLASTYLGTTTKDVADLMDIDHNNDIYICGSIPISNSLTATPGTYSNPSGQNVIYKVNSSLSNLIYKTKFGSISPGPAYLNYSAFHVDSCEKVYIAGFCENNFPTTSNAIQFFAGGITDIYMAVFNSNCSSLAYASYFGGSASGFGAGEHNDGGLSHFDDKGHLYQGICSSGGLPTTPGAYATTYVPTSTTSATNYNDAFLKVDFQTFVNASSSYGANIVGCPPPFNAQFDGFTNTGSVSWDFGDGSPLSNQNSVSHIYQNTGTYNVVLVVSDSTTCNKIDSIKSTLTVRDPIVFDLGEDKYLCDNNPVLLQSNTSALTYSWNNGATTPDITINTPGKYYLTVDNGACKTSDSVNVIMGQSGFEMLFPNVVTPNNDGVNDVVDFKKYGLNEIDFLLVDRWGNERYKTKDPISQWNPINYEDGSYFFMINYKSSCSDGPKQLKGFITVFR